MVESQIKQAEEDRKHEEEYAKMELVLQNNLMRTKVWIIRYELTGWGSRNDVDDHLKMLVT